MTLYRVSAKPPAPPDPYLLAWAKLRRRRTTIQAMFFAFLPTCVVAAVLLQASWWVAMVPYMAIYLASCWMAAYFPCPHCGRAFGKKNTGARDSRVFLRRCFQCGIAMGTPRSAVERTPPSEQRVGVQESPSVAGGANPDSELERDDVSPDARSESRSP